MLKLRPGRSVECNNSLRFAFKYKRSPGSLLGLFLSNSLCYRLNNTRVVNRNSFKVVAFWRFEFKCLNFDGVLYGHAYSPLYLTLQPLSFRRRRTDGSFGHVTPHVRRNTGARSTLQDARTTNPVIDTMRVTEILTAACCWRNLCKTYNHTDIWIVCTSDYLSPPPFHTPTIGHTINGISFHWRTH